LLLPSRREAPITKIGAVILLAAGLIFAAVLVRYAAGAGGSGLNAYFWIFSTIGLVGAIRVITHPKPVYSALYFVLTVFATAGLFLLLWAEFMAAALVLIYAGAILVTYVFVIMLAAEAAPAGAAARGLSDHDAVAREPVLACAVGFALMGVLLFVIFDKAQGIDRPSELFVGGGDNKVPTVPASANAALPNVKLNYSYKDPYSNEQSIVSGATQELGEFLLKKHLVSLELAGLILTISMIGSIVIARRNVWREAPGVEYIDEKPEVVLGPSTPVDDNPHSLPVVGTFNPRQKAYPET
jgi:NADH-quinone oxidoreductase subunit J